MLELGATALVAMSLFVLVKGHGYLVDPPQRSSLWRFGYDNPVNYNDNELFCGGFGVQFNNVNKGKCGVCGDPYSQQKPRDNEAGGKYARSGIIAGSYVRGSVMPVKVNITANHMGYFEFRLCPNNDFNTTVTEECLNNNVLVVNGAGTRHNISSDIGAHQLYLTLPSAITCDQCVLQWKYVTGNSWGCGTNGTCCVGCGNQEHFINCADIKISDPSVTQTGTSSTQSATMSVISSATTTATPPSASTSTSSTSSSSIKTSTSSSTSTTTPSITSSSSKKTSTTISSTSTPSTTTTATTPSTPGLSTSTTQTPTTTSGGANCIRYTVTSTYLLNPGMLQWCIDNCSVGYCPKTHCISTPC